MLVFQFYKKLYFHSVPTISGFLSETRCEVGEEVVIKAKVGGYPPPTLVWYHDGKQVMTDYATELDENGGLTFPSVEAKHAGENTQCTHTLYNARTKCPCLLSCVDLKKYLCYVQESCTVYASLI